MLKMPEGTLISDRQWYSVDVKSFGGKAVRFTASWTDEDFRDALHCILRLESRVPTEGTQLCWVQINDSRGALRFVTAWDWTDEDRQFALLKIDGLACGLPGAGALAFLDMEQHPRPAKMNMLQSDPDANGAAVGNPRRLGVPLAFDAGAEPQAAQTTLRQRL